MSGTKQERCVRTLRTEQRMLQINTDGTRDWNIDDPEEGQELRAFHTEMCNAKMRFVRHHRRLNLLLFRLGPFGSFRKESVRQRIAVVKGLIKIADHQCEDCIEWMADEYYLLMAIGPEPKPEDRIHTC